MEQMTSFHSGPIHTHVIPSTTFKTTTFVLQMRAPLEEETATERALLPQVLQRGTKHFPSRLHIQGALEELYGASFHADTVKKGESHVMTFRIEVANEAYLKDQTPLTERAFKLLSSILLHPDSADHAFKDDYVKEEIRNHKQKIEAIYDDKMRYANMRLTQEMCQDEPFAIQALGTLERLEKINGASLYKAYHQALLHDQLDLFVMGDIQKEEVDRLVTSFFTLPVRHDAHSIKAPSSKQIDSAKELIEEQEIKQAKLHIGFRTHTRYGDEDYFALQVFNGIFGGFSHSKLFINVREKASLAYYAASRVESQKGLLIVLAGIDSSKFDEATTIIHKQMEDMRSGSFTEDDLAQTKSVLRNQILETIDVPRGRIELEYQHLIGGGKGSLDDILQGLEQVTMEDVIKVAAKIQLDTTYFLKGKEVS
ncbi:insulinase family protein [Paenalkalicoccus suaedae]|uniref:Insulinase family protein n=1 Tax=Paenalkalicoccus suaedae TaxID=2592382 RepID=A0A859FE60_9BACI|nr:pitrilysin family protein [Paenalkalicoccus suaedae]QKS71377.1 insulinase family protein [Paenalkalicoccus suaedae]